jgi:hypothetical protein
MMTKIPRTRCKIFVCLNPDDFYDYIRQRGVLKYLTSLSDYPADPICLTAPNRNVFSNLKTGFLLSEFQMMSLLTFSRKAQAGLPDGLFSNKKSNLGKLWRTLEWKILVLYISYGHLEYFTGIWYMLWPFGNVVVIWHIPPPPWGGVLWC